MTDDVTQAVDDPIAQEQVEATDADNEAPDRLGDIVILGVLAFIAGWFQIGLVVALSKGGLNLFTGIFVPANLGLFWLVYVMTADLYPGRSRGKTVALTFAAEAVALLAIMGPIAAVAFIGAKFG